MSTQTAVFGGGCFWCTEAAFQRVRGVTHVVPGYAGGQVTDPSYQQVSSGRTGHAEVVKVDFDPEIVSYKDLLKVFFAVHDPTTLNRQGNDIGPQYRSVILYTSEEQKKAATDYIAELNKEIGGGIITEVKPLTEFFEAEEYHHNYFNRNPYAGYCQAIISPKVAKLRKSYAELLEEQD